MEIKDSGERTTFSTGAQRDNGEKKGRFSLIPPSFLQRMAIHMEAGAAKYTDRNWEAGMPLSRYVDAIWRHLGAWMMGDTSEPHLSAVGWNIMCLSHTYDMIRAGKLPAELNDLPGVDMRGDSLPLEKLFIFSRPKGDALHQGWMDEIPVETEVVEETPVEEPFDNPSTKIRNTSKKIKDGFKKATKRTDTPDQRHKGADGILYPFIQGYEHNGIVYAEDSAHGIWEWSSTTNRYKSATLPQGATLTNKVIMTDNAKVFQRWLNSPIPPDPALDRALEGFGS